MAASTEEKVRIPTYQPPTDVSSIDEPTINNLRHVSREGSLLLQLPAELRNRIYTEVLTGSTPITVTSPTHNISGGTARALLRTCRKIRSEASTMHYSINAFSFKVSGPDYMLDRQLATWISTIEPKCRESLSEIRIDDRPYSKWIASEMIEECHHTLLARGIWGVGDVLFVKVHKDEESSWMNMAMMNGTA